MHALCLIDLAFVPGDAGKIFAWRGFQWCGFGTVLVRFWYGVERMKFSDDLRQC